MECNEVFSISRSTILGQGKPLMSSNQQANSRLDVLWNGPPVGSLAAQSAQSGRAPAAVSRRRTSRDQQQDNDVGPSIDGVVTSVGLCDAAVLKITDVTNGINLTVVDEHPDSEVDRLTATEKLLSTGRQWLQLCHCDAQLLPIKVFYFAFIGALGVVLPFAAVFLKQLGLSAFQIGIISGIRPILGFVSAPAWGAAADRYSIRRVLMLISMLAWLGFFTGLYFVAEPRRRGYCPESMWSVTRQTSIRNERSVQQMQFNNITTDVVDYSSTVSFSYFSTGHSSSSSSNMESATTGSLTAVNSTLSAVITNSLATTRTFDKRDVIDTSTTSLSTTTTTTTMNTSGKLPEPNNETSRSQATIELLRENLEWLYDPTDAYRVFIICLLIICGGELFQAPTTAMSDAATLQILGRDGLHKYGAQRAWGPIGWATSSLMIGAILDASSRSEVICEIQLKFNDYRLISIVFVAFFVFSFVAALKINFATKIVSNNNNTKSSETTKYSSEARSETAEKQSNECPSEKHDTLNTIKVFLNVRNGTWLFTTFFVGVCNGVIWGFLFWHLDNLGASRVMMGVDTVVVCVFEFGAYFIVDYVVNCIGHMGVMYTGLLGYTIRFIVYAAVSNPWTVLPVEILQGVTFSFIWVSQSQYTAAAVPTVSLGTVQGIIHGVYFGLGNGVGHLVGGVMIGSYGAVVTFYTFAVANVVWLVIFAFCQKLSKKPTDPFAYREMNEDCKATTAADMNTQ